MDFTSFVPSVAVSFLSGTMLVLKKCTILVYFEWKWNKSDLGLVAVECVVLQEP